jgi:hypothetical protein
MNKKDKYFLSIKQIYPQTISVVKPITAGLVHDVYIAECQDNKYICRFSNEIVAKHNLQVSQILTSYNIPVPKVSIYNCGEHYCETYPFIPGKTLHERILEGLSDEKLDNVYRQIFDISYKISEIPYENIKPIPVPFVSKILRRSISCLNLSQKKLCHTDLHAKNIVLDEQDDVSAILDLDAFSMEPMAVAYFIMLKDSQTYGYDLNRLNETLNKLNIRNIGTQINIINAATQMYHFVFPECLRKQLLKIRVR